MTNFFCSDLTRQSQTALGGTGLPYENYVLVECPPPWTSYDLESQSIPDNLRAIGEEIYQKPITWKYRILLIYNPAYRQSDRTRVLVFRKPNGFWNGYVGKEFFVSDIKEVAPLARECFADEPWEPESSNIQTREILVCTHGQNDRCCARYGNPLYREALKIVSDLSLDRVRIWQTSHIGGHRFAPTAIDFPDGRYYGQISSSSLQTILTRSGSIQDLHSAYRGWGILPKPVQVLEKELLLKWGWKGLNNSVKGRILEESEDGNYNRVELQVKQSDGSAIAYRGTVVIDESKTLELPESCVGNYWEKAKTFIVKNVEKVEGVFRSE